jgi:hypothetical protein
VLVVRQQRARALKEVVEFLRCAEDDIARRFEVGWQTEFDGRGGIEAWVW